MLVKQKGIFCAIYSMLLPCELRKMVGEIDWPGIRGSRLTGPTPQAYTKIDKRILTLGQMRCNDQKSLVKQFNKK